MTSQELARWLPDLACILMCGIAAVHDLRTYQIPNWLCAAGVVVGLAVNAAFGHVLPALAGGGVLLLAAGPLGGLRLFGMGDVKLLVAVGTLVRWPLAPRVLLYMALAGGVVALVLSLRRRALPRVARGAWTSPPPSHRMPYGLAIALGVLWAIASRDLPWLRMI